MKIAIIGSGISGLGAAYLLHPYHEIAVYEKNAELGGFSHTVDVQTPRGIMPVDTGFMAFNERTSPNVSALFKRLNVPLHKSEMTFGVSINDGWLEYGTQNLASMFAPPDNVWRLPFWRLLAGRLRFNRAAHRYLNSNKTFGEMLDELGISPWAQRYYVVPLAGAILNAPLDQVRHVPAAQVIHSFENQGLLPRHGLAQWCTVVGGAREYVRRLTEDYWNAIHPHTAVTRVIRKPGEVIVEDARGGSRIFDQVIFACHADQAVQLLAAPTVTEQNILGRFRTQKTSRVLHSDTRFMPQNKKCWASRVYLEESREQHSPRQAFTYWMNHLQGLDPAMPLFVTLNPGSPPDPHLVHDRHECDTPIFDAPALAAQKDIGQIQGANDSWYCGAYQGYGCQEDGLLSAMHVVRKMGHRILWE